MKYRTVLRDQQIGLLTQRLASLESEHFQHTVNLDLLAEAKKAGDDTEITAEAIKQAKDSISIIERAHAQVVARLEKLGVEFDEQGQANRATRRRAAKGGKAQVDPTGPTQV